MTNDILSLSNLERFILELILSGRTDPYGLDLVDRSGGRLKRGSIYVTLHRMEDKGYITSYEEERPPAEGGLPRRRYRIAALGEQALRHWTVPSSGVWAPA